MSAPDPGEALRLLEPGARHLHTLGPRAVAEFLAWISGDYGSLPAILATLELWRTVTPERLRAAGGDRFPRRLRVVPKVGKP